MTIILNPASGAHRISGLRASLAGALPSARIVAAREGSEVARIARDAVRAGEEIVVAGGGDGTIGAAASAVAGTSAALGVLPVGTFNHFAKDAGIPLDIGGATEVLRSGRITQVDVGEVNGRVFVNNSSLGLYAHIVARRRLEQRLGAGKWIALVRSTFAAFIRYPLLHVRVQAGGETIVRRTPFIFVGNNRYEVEGFNLGTRPRLDGGRLWLYISPRGETRRELVGLALRALAGRLKRSREFQAMDLESLRVETRFRRVRVATDGELAWMDSPLEYRIRPRALNLVAPRETA
jgi:diacylglycerol kinase family enzyme